MVMHQWNSGLKPLRPDARDSKFSHSRLFGVASLADLPKEGLGRVPYKINNQLGYQFCTAGTSSASEYQEKTALSFEFQIAAISRLNGQPIVDGCEPRVAMGAACAYGSIPDDLTPSWMRLTDLNASVVTAWKNWPQDLWDAARSHLKSGYFPVDAPLEPFDRIREALWQGRTENQAVMAFGNWYNSFNLVLRDGIISTGCRTFLGLHYYTIIDWTMIEGKEYLVVQNQYGTQVAKQGIYFFDRPTINEAWKDTLHGDGTGLFIFRDVDDQTLQALKDQKATLTSILLSLYQKILFKWLYGITA